MKYKSVATNVLPWAGVVYTEKVMVVPNMSMSLQEILERFTRGEPLEIGQDTAFDEEGDDDLEKVRHMDLVDREEYINRLKHIRKTFDKQQRKKKKDFEDAARLAAIEEIKAAEKAALAAKEKP